MEILVIMVAGALLGRFAVPERARRVNDVVQTVLTCLLIASMGTSLAARDGFFGELGAYGVQALVLCALPMVCSIVFVGLLAYLLMGDGPGGPAARAATDIASHPEHADEAPHLAPASGGAPSVAAVDGTTVQGASASTWAGSRDRARRLKRILCSEPMVTATFIALALGVVFGVLARGSLLVDLVRATSEGVLCALMFSVGVGVGMHRGLVRSIREHHIKTLAIPVGVVAGSLAGGVMGGLLCGAGAREGMAVASGLGWYSLAGVTIEQLAGPGLGTIAFLANLMRELASFFLIPWIARHVGFAACIAAGAATSEDTTLPMMIRCTDERTVVFSVVNGIICSACVPVLLAACLG